MFTSQQKNDILKKHLTIISLYESKNNIDRDLIIQIEKNEYVNSIYFVGLFYLYNLHNDIFMQNSDIIKTKFFDEYFNYFANGSKDISSKILKEILNIMNISS